MRLLILLLFVPITLRAQAPQPTWEYGTLTTLSGHPFVWTATDSSHTLDAPSSTADAPNVAFVAYLNRLGRDHWELVASQLQGPGTAIYVFKRRKS